MDNQNQQFAVDQGMGSPMGDPSVPPPPPPPPSMQSPVMGQSGPGLVVEPSSQLDEQAQDDFPAMPAMPSFDDMADDPQPAPVAQPPAEPAVADEQTLTQLEAAVSQVSETIKQNDQKAEEGFSQPAAIDQVLPAAPGVNEATLPPMPKLNDEFIASSEPEPAAIEPSINDELPPEATRPVEEPVPAESVAPESGMPTVPQGDDIVKPAPMQRGSSSNSELDDIKMAALKELAPIADKLDQPPQERFETLMKLIHATDNKDLVRPTLESAKSIENEAARAQALLDVVNEVDYLESEQDQISA